MWLFSQKRLVISMCVVYLQIPRPHHLFHIPCPQRHEMQQKVGVHHLHRKRLRSIRVVYLQTPTKQSRVSFHRYRSLLQGLFYKRDLSYPYVSFTHPVSIDAWMHQKRPTKETCLHQTRPDKQTEVFPHRFRSLLWGTYMQKRFVISMCRIPTDAYKTVTGVFPQM